MFHCGLSYRVYARRMLVSNFFCSSLKMGMECVVVNIGESQAKSYNVMRLHRDHASCQYQYHASYFTFKLLLSYIKKQKKPWITKRFVWFILKRGATSHILQTQRIMFVAVQYASFLTFNDAIRVVELGPYRYAGDVDCERTRCVVGVLHGCLDID